MSRRKKAGNKGKLENGSMELYNEEKGPYRKKDKVAYYYDDEDNFVMVPKMTDDKGQVIPFLRVCMNQTEDTILELWDEALARNQLVLDTLEQLRTENESDDTSRWQSIAYAKAIKELKKLKIPIVSGEQARKIKGIGKGIAGAIDEVLRTGKIKPKEEREKAKDERNKALDLFMEIWGVSKKIAAGWYGAGYRSVEDIPDDELTDEQRIGIKYRDELNLPIEREDIDNIKLWISENAEQISDTGVTKMYITGEYRRGADTSIISILAASDNPSKGVLTSLLKLFPPFIPSMHKTGSKFSTETIIDLSKFGGKGHRKMVVTLVPDNILGAALLVSTGPDAFVLQLREQAAQMGYRLSEDGLVKISGEEEEVIDTSEKDIFKLLGMEYISPRDRF